MRDRVKVDGIIKPGDLRAIPPLPALTPLVGIYTGEMSNINDVLYMTPMHRARAVKAARQKGYKLGLMVGDALRIPIRGRDVVGPSGRVYKRLMLTQTLTMGKVFTRLTVWHKRATGEERKSNRKQDIFNPITKALIDGLTDAGLWEDDNAESHTDYWVTFGGLADFNFYELAFYAIGE